MSKSSTSLRTAAAVSLTALALFGTGCASIVHNGPRAVSIGSQPSGAKTTVSKRLKDGTLEVVSVQTTPCTVALKPKAGFFKGQAYTVAFELPGYASSTVELKPTMSGWYLGNIVFGGLIGLLIVDPATGAMWNLSPDKIVQPLTTAQASVIRSGEGFVVMLPEQLTPAEKSAMVRIN
jgi:hypothetical protein